MLFKLSLYIGEFKHTFWHLIFKTVGKIQEIKKRTRNDIGMTLCAHIKTDMTFSIFIQCPGASHSYVKNVKLGLKSWCFYFL